MLFITNYIYIFSVPSVASSVSSPALHKADSYAQLICFETLQALIFN